MLPRVPRLLFALLPGIGVCIVDTAQEDALQHGFC